MKRFVEGTYNTVDTANLAIDTLLNKGFTKADITLIVNEPSARDFEAPPGIRTLFVDLSTEEETGLWAKIKDIFSQEDRATELIRDDELLARYEDQLADGQLLLLVESDLTVVDRHSGDSIRELLASDPKLSQAEPQEIQKDGVIIPPVGTGNQDIMSPSGQTLNPPPLVNTNDLDDIDEEDPRKR